MSRKFGKVGVGKFWKLAVRNFTSDSATLLNTIKNLALQEK